MDTQHTYIRTDNDNTLGYLMAICILYLPSHEDKVSVSHLAIVK